MSSPSPPSIVTPLVSIGEAVESGAGTSGGARYRKGPRSCSERLVKNKKTRETPVVTKSPHVPQRAHTNAPQICQKKQTPEPSPPLLSPLLPPPLLPTAAAAAYVVVEVLLAHHTITKCGTTLPLGKKQGVRRRAVRHRASAEDLRG